MANEKEEPVVLSWQKKFLLILWKNLCVLLGRKCQFACLVIVSIFSALAPLLLGFASNLASSIREEDSPFIPHNSSEIIVCYSPQNKILETFLSGVTLLDYPTYFRDFADGKALEEALTKNISYEGAFGIEFPDEWSDITELPHRFRFALRFSVDKEDSFFLNILISQFRTQTHYRRTGFLLLQTQISQRYLQVKNGTQTVFRTQFKELYEEINLSLDDMFVIFLICVFLCPFTMDVKDIVQEKELQLKEMLNIFDVSNYLQWLAWYVKSMIVLFMVSLIITILWTAINMPAFRGGNPFADMAVLPHTDWSVFLFYLLVCSHCLICFGFLVSSFCARSGWCAIIAVLLFLASSLPNFVIDKDSTGTVVNILCSIFVVSAMNMVMDRIVIWEKERLGLQWSNLFKTSWLHDSISVGAILMIMLLISLISILICLYMEQVRPGEFGTPQPWYFPCTKRFWCPAKYMRGVLSPPGLFPVRPSDEERPLDRSSPPKHSKFVDANARGKTSGVQIKNLSKSFGKRQVVAGLTFDLFENEIMVLLGHNGAGKTTTIQMLTGTIQPSSGTAIINGYDIQTDRLQARRSLSICPQKNIFFDGLSVASHLQFYSRLRGLKAAAVKQEVDKYIQKLGLKAKARSSAKSLSGGTQRRLALACALCGNVKVLFCDEPSSGLDPNSRHELWKLLLDEKQGRTILLTTHQMDEGEVLADRIAIVSDGRLRCLGTLAFLKKQNETSYLLTCEKGPNCNVSRLTQLIASHVPNTRPHSNIGSDVSYRLPHRVMGSLGSLFNDLEQQKEQLDVVGFGLSSTSLADIFMSHGAEDLGGSGGRTSGGGSNEQSQRQNQEQNRYQNFCLRYLGQWEAMLLKKMLYIYDKKWIFLALLLLPIVIAIIVLIREPSEGSMLKRLPITLADYKSDDVKIILQSTSNTGPARDMANAYQELVQQYGSVERTSQNIEEYIGKGQETPERIYEMKRSLIAAATFDQETIAWVRMRVFLHSAPLSLNLVFNAMAKTMVGPNASIEVTNAPYQGKNSQRERMMSLIMAICVMLYLAIVLGMFGMLVAQEKVTQTRMQQQVSGVNMATYWLSHYLTDLALYFVLSLALLLAVHELCHPLEMLLILMVIGVAVLPLTYMMVGLFKDSGTAVVIMINLNIVCGVFLGFLLALTFPMIPIGAKKEFMAICYLYPVITGYFAVANCFARFQKGQSADLRENYKMYCTPGFTLQIDFCSSLNLLDWVEVRYLLICGFIYMLILIFAEYITMLWYGIKQILCRCCRPNVKSNDGDVAAVAERIKEMSGEDRNKHALVLNRVSKRYLLMSAVRGISFAVKPGVCFGLLGANGAGKTTTFKMIVGDIGMTTGSIHVRGCSLMVRPTAARKQIGYCPQHDTLFDFCTGRQTLRIFLLLRGTRRELLKKAIEKLASDFGFFVHLDHKVKDYSGGTKRKLNAAVASEGLSLICLDEPSSGVDPASRRHVWNVLSSLRDEGKAVMLSSHSMEEVEALCTQLAIMADGQIHCLGSQQRIKNKFAQCLVLKLHVETSPESMVHTVQKVKSQMEADYPTSSLEEEFGGRLTYHIPTDKLRWSRVFSYIERNRSPWKLADYSLTQPSLEDVLLDIAKKKKNEKNQQTNPPKTQSRPEQKRATKNESPKPDKDKGRSTRGNKD
ncbi:retinal-specific phospholipid-transporting ATPase ABCA4 [Drosophila guanche]|uniref:Blast:ATP-binding cassette sub-family A member 3 n=1 Tax=Drosophila guanche TaxID=7266 RepID=A0A3B0J4K3_DROGU|nr:retinal-specific phospholipid-transporting ATPase ABCA4 [Drosophila guanche]SPP76445.1 blast:ATP-binding cassette sub-family A member 3 [Drosophila guanche]